jgi:5-methylcytosine-specific restriction protein A
MVNRPCLEPSCPRFATLRGYCKVHTTARNKRQRSANNSFYASKRWRMTRRRKLSLDPFCESQEICNGALANEVHHIKAIEAGGARYAIDNLMSLCRPCHSAKTRREQLAR